MSKVEM